MTAAVELSCTGEGLLLVSQNNGKRKKKPYRRRHRSKFETGTVWHCIAGLDGKAWEQHKLSLMDLMEIGGRDGQRESGKSC